MLQKLNDLKQNPNFPFPSGNLRLRENPPAHNDTVSSYSGGRCPSSLPRMDERPPSPANFSLPGFPLTPHPI